MPIQRIIFWWFNYFLLKRLQYLTRKTTEFRAIEVKIAILYPLKTVASKTFEISKNERNDYSISGYSCVLNKSAGTLISAVEKIPTGTLI